MRAVAPSRYGYTYDDLITSMEVEVLIEVSDDDYQGDTRALVKDGNRYGVLTFGWGSCSGCDALQAAWGYRDEDDPEAIRQITELRDQMWGEIHWEPDATSILRYLREKDWSLEYMDGEETRRFVAESTKALNATP